MWYSKLCRRLLFSVGRRASPWVKGVTRVRRAAGIWVFILGTVVLTGQEAGATAISFRQSGVPDFGQFADPEWQGCYCAPAAAANYTWWFAGRGFPLLVPEGHWGDAQAAADVIDVLGMEMHTNVQSGTVFSNVRSGWQQYLTSFYPGQFEVQLINARDIGGGEQLWNLMKQRLAVNDAVVPLVLWESGKGHAVSMTEYFDDPNVVGDEWLGINDPATRGSVHHWDGEYLPISLVGFQRYGIDLERWSSGLGSISSIVVARAVPEPTSLPDMPIVWLISIVSASHWGAVKRSRIPWEVATKRRVSRTGARSSVGG